MYYKMVRIIDNTAWGPWPLFSLKHYYFYPQSYFYIIHRDGILDVGSAVGSTSTIMLVLRQCYHQKHTFYTSTFAMTLFEGFQLFLMNKVCFFKKRVKSQNMIFR